MFAPGNRSGLAWTTFWRGTGLAIYRLPVEALMQRFKDGLASTATLLRLIVWGGEVN
jgi:hypothetical protein